MSRRRAYLDEGIGERRGVVTLDGLPERLIIERDDDPPSQRLGARSIARVRSVEKGLGIAFLTMPDGRDAALRNAAGRSPPEGSSLEVEVTAEAQGGKAAIVTAIAPSNGDPCLVSPAQPLEARLAVWSGAEPLRGSQARAIADEAQALALETAYPLPGGGGVAIETTRSLTAIDIDLGARLGDAAQNRRKANLAAIALGARLLRLKGQGGLVVFDLAGRGHDGKAIAAAAKDAFGADDPGVSIGPVSRFGLFELALPRRFTPLREQLMQADGRPTLRTVVQTLLREVERHAVADPGGQLEIRCSPEVSTAAERLLVALRDRIGARFTVSPRLDGAREHFEVSVK